LLGRLVWKKFTDVSEVLAVFVIREIVDGNVGGPLHGATTHMTATLIKAAARTSDFTKFL
jgi:hypothetical protein